MEIVEKFKCVSIKHEDHVTRVTFVDESGEEEIKRTFPNSRNVGRFLVGETYTIPVQ